MIGSCVPPPPSPIPTSVEVPPINQCALSMNLAFYLSPKRLGSLIIQCALLAGNYGNKVTLLVVPQTNVDTRTLHYQHEKYQPSITLRCSLHCQDIELFHLMRMHITLENNKIHNFRRRKYSEKMHNIKNTSDKILNVVDFWSINKILFFRKSSRNALPHLLYPILPSLRKQTQFQNAHCQSQVWALQRLKKKNTKGDQLALVIWMSLMIQTRKHITMKVVIIITGKNAIYI